MSKKLIVFGSGDMADLAYYYFTNDSSYEVVAFTLDPDYIDSPILFGLPVIPFDDITNKYPPAEYDIFIALGYTKVNQVRKEKYLKAKSLGYKIASYISSYATVLNENKIGENCFLLENNTIQPYVEIGNNVTLWSGNHIGHHSRIHDHCFITSHVVISGGVTIEEQCFIGVNATLRDRITVGAKCVIGAGALLLKDTQSEELYIGSATKKIDKKSTELKKI